MSQELQAWTRLVGVRKAVEDKRVVVSKGILRELVSKDPTLPLSLGGHRGMGMNILNADETPSTHNFWRENTMRSFKKAYQHGARFVEMDVQVTADGVPVIWHDDEIVFGSQFNPTISSIAELHSKDFQAVGAQKLDEGSRARFSSPLLKRMNSQMGTTVFRNWRCFDDDALPSLAEVLETLPVDLGVNLEIKMASSSNGVQTPQAEIDRMTVPILEQLQRHIYSDARRSIVTSSFDPEICLAMRRQLPDNVPVMFITTGAANSHVDPRRTTISAAIDFCTAYTLTGLVVDTSKLYLEPHFIHHAISKGLQMMTYGLQNSDIDWLRKQSKLGVHGAVIDDVASVIRSFLTTVSNHPIQPYVCSILKDQVYRCRANNCLLGVRK